MSNGICVTATWLFACLIWGNISGMVFIFPLCSIPFSVSKNKFLKNNSCNFFTPHVYFSRNFKKINRNFHVKQNFIFTENSFTLLQKFNITILEIKISGKRHFDTSRKYSKLFKCQPPFPNIEGCNQNHQPRTINQEPATRTINQEPNYQKMKKCNYITV
jgi:hypothetical protein